jgi:hypothetical protein
MISLSLTSEALQARAKRQSRAGSSIVLPKTVDCTGGPLVWMCWATPPGENLLLLWS